MLKEAQDVKNQAIQTLENAKANEAEKRAKAVLEAAKQAVEAAEKNFQKGDAKVKELYKELEAAQKDYEAKAAEHSESKAAYENAQKDYDTVVEAITPLREAKAEYDKAVA